MSGELRIIWGLYGCPDTFFPRDPPSEGLCTWLNTLLLPPWNLNIFEQQAPYFHFVLSPLNYVAGDVLPLSQFIFINLNSSDRFLSRGRKCTEHKGRGMLKERGPPLMKIANLKTKINMFPCRKVLWFLTPIYGNTMCQALDRACISYRIHKLCHIHSHHCFLSCSSSVS